MDNARILGEKFARTRNHCFLRKPSGAGAGNSDPTMPEVLRRNRDASAIPGIWTNSPSESTSGGSIFGVPWIRMVKSSMLLQPRRDQRAAERFLRRLLRGQEPSDQ